MYEIFKISANKKSHIELLTTPHFTCGPFLFPFTSRQSRDIMFIPMQKYHTENGTDTVMTAIKDNVSICPNAINC